MNKKVLLCLAISICIGMTGCEKANNEIDTLDNQTTNEDMQFEMENTVSDNENSQIMTENAVSDNETSQAETLLDEFIAGEKEAFYLNSEISFFITDLNMNRDEWDSYSVGERVDLDNDGENELILSGPYGGMYLDVLNGKIVVFAQGAGTADLLSYVYYEDAYWVVNRDTTHSGRQFYTFTQYSGSDTIVDSFDLNAEYWDQQEYDENSEFTYRGNSISMEEYEEIYHAIFGE